MKLTDNEIIKALECCTNEDLECKDCPSHDFCDNNTFEMLRCILDLINRQRAEIERLRKVLENRGEICKSCDEKYTEKIKRAKAEAIKEFAERLKEIAIEKGSVPIVFVDIDNLVKEMVGKNEDSN